MSLEPLRSPLLVACLAVGLVACGSEVRETPPDPPDDTPAGAVADRPEEPESRAPTANDEEPEEQTKANAATRDLTAFHGEYGPPDDPESSRTWWVTTEPCEERGLRVGAMWGNATPWNLEPESDTVFVGSAFGGRTVRAAFAPEGETPRSLRLEVGDDTTELIRFGDLPEGFATRCTAG